MIHSMELSPEICERARQARDPRFDGRFFIAVRTTGVFCRPTCPVQPPKAKNVRFYPTAAAALAAGFRPCLRCLPELAPGQRRFSNGQERIDYALKLIDGGFLDRHGTSQLAARIGITARHLSREFEQYLGATPHRVAHTRRLLFAKHLLDESDLSVTDIAFASGFGSLRRFNSAVKDTWSRPPGELRKRRARPDAGGAIRLTLGYRPPLNWEALLEFFRQRAISGVESVSENAYSRTILVGERAGRIHVRPAESGHRLELTVNLPDVRFLSQLAARVRRMFDLDADPMAVQAVLGGDAMLASVLENKPGLRIPGAWDPFEISIRAIVGQQVSVAAARTLINRIVSALGDPLEDTPDDQPHRLFPSPERLARAPLESLGITRSRARTIRHLAGEVAAGRIDLEGTGTVSALTALPGIGDWTAQYIALRSGNDPDAFPASDLGLLRGAENGEAMTPARLRKKAETWRPWRAYAAICLWRRYEELRST